MKMFAFIVLYLFATVIYGYKSSAQSVVYAQLYLSTNGSGSISPLQSGQLLEVGQSYDITATPDPGFLFSGWQMIIVNTYTQAQLDTSGNLTTNISIVPSLKDFFIGTSTMTFTMQPDPLFLDYGPGNDPRIWT